MQYVNLLCAHSERPDLREFAEAFFKAIGLVDGHERESSHYVDDHYFKGSREGIEFKVMLSDEECNEDLPIWVQITANIDATGALEDAMDRVVRERLLPAGFRVARMTNFGKHDAQRIDYT